MAGIIPAAGSSAGGSKFRRRRYAPIADINVTPMVDVMLVLLVIFMITAPLLQVGVPVDLPKTSAQQVGGKDEPLVVSVNSKDEVFL
ncbi:MAG TPA: biopolymer transporter ExbD, partial [Reyranella sp.]|nr:biopolymer transporter ExbD [Reyranella sp.]